MDEQKNDFLAKFAQNRYTEEEHDQFMEWLKTASDQRIRQLLDEYPNLTEENPGPSFEHLQLINKIEATLDKEKQQTVRKLRLSRLYIAATVAAVLIVATGVLIYFLNSERQHPQFIVQKQIPSPSKNGTTIGARAMLTLANGSAIILDTAANGLLTTQGGIAIRKSAGGQLIFDTSQLATFSAPGGFNTISTPRGGQYQVYLSDGTKVWLNATSSLRFPVSFTGDERRVELTGEAYFEVAKNNARPFKVASGNQTVEVLGTHFNINAYFDEGDIRTTLLEGSIRLFQNETNQSKLLKPGQQALLKEEIRVFNVDAEQAIAWMNGYFVFGHENIKSIMLKISRWYDVEVQYEGAVTRETFIGRVSRYENVSELLEILELSGLVHFKIDGKKITVIP